MPDNARGLPMWMGFVIIALLLVCVFLLFFNKNAGEDSSMQDTSGQVKTDAEVYKIITRENMEFALVVDKEGALAMVTADEKYLPRCGLPGDSQLKTCTFFREEGVHAKAINHIFLSKYNYEYNPDCILYEVVINKVKHYFTAPPGCR